MNDLEYTQVKLSDGTIMFGFKGDYITSVISSTKDYYEINDLRKFFRYIPSEPIIYDIGSNIGNHTIFFNKYYKAKKIYSFEPIPMNADLLEKNINENKLSNIEIFRKAVGKKSGRADFIINEKNMGECKLVENPEGSVSVVSIDELNLDYPSFIKIDVEGAELDVLSGMTKILSSSNPVIWVEINENFHEVDRFLGQYQYELIDKHHFNHIYIKCNSIEERLQNLQAFKENIVREFNQTVIDKWNLNKWLSSEKEKVKKSEDEKIREKQSFDAKLQQIEKDKNQLENEKQELSHKIMFLNEKIQRIEYERACDKQVFEAEIQRYESENRRYESEIRRYEAELQRSEVEKENYLLKIANYKNASKQYEAERQELNKKLLQHIEMEKQVLNELKALKQHYQLIESRYMRLRNSLPGKIAVRLWKFMKRFK